MYSAAPANTPVQNVARNSIARIMETILVDFDDPNFPQFVVRKAFHFLSVEVR
jgi:hypothetical protein